jgi:transposase InsO family protein
MDFIVGLPRTQAGYDSIWVIVDRLTKVAHFIPVKTTYSGAKLAELYMSRIMCLHGVPKKIVSDRGSQFTSKFWEKLHESMDTKLNFSSAYHPQMDGQTERTNQILEDMLRACALKGMEKVGTRGCRTQNSHTTIVIKLVSRWLHMKRYTDASAELHVLESNRRKSSFRTQSTEGCREASSDGS